MSGKGKTRDEIVEERKRKKSEIMPESEQTFLFFSIDIVNSTKFKTQNSGNWAVPLWECLTRVIKLVEHMLPNARFWKSIGDEVLFYIPIRDIQEILKALDAIYSITRDNQFGNGLPQCSYECDGNMLLKSTAWIVPVGKKKFRDNVITTFEGNEHVIVEFLGTEIDAGFRVAKETRARQLALSFELAYVLTVQLNRPDLSRVMTVKTLKGVWNENAYPILWYFNQKIAHCENFEDSVSNEILFGEQIGKDYLLYTTIDTVQKDKAKFLERFNNINDRNDCLHKICTWIH